MRSQPTATLLKDSFQRLRFADGFSHARALAFQAVLTVLPGVIVVVGLAAVAHSTWLSTSIRETIDSLAPGPAGDLFRAAFDQGESKGAEHSGRNALIVGGIAMFIAGTTAFGQVERAANRIYGIEADRKPLAKYGRAALLMSSAGSLLIGYFVSVGIGRGLADSIDDGSPLRTAFVVLRWPLGAILLGGAFAIVVKLCPHRHQPRFSWLVVGGLVAVTICLAVSLAFHAYLDLSTSFGETYGPLAGFMGLMLWTYLNAIGLLFGIAFAAQLESVRSGHAAVRDLDRARALDLSVAVPGMG
jgi:YihY family inner membrane protein